MNKNLDLTEILKGCPERTKFYSSYLGKDVFFTGINNNYIECEYLPQIGSPFNCNILFRKEGSLYKGGECMLFPSKDQRDWSKWQRPFKDGDILAYTSSYTTVFIYRNKDNEPKHTTSFYVGYNIGACSYNFHIYNKGVLIALNGDCDTRFATEEEKQKLFDVIKKNGYKWNAETKTLEKLKKEKFDPKTLQPFDKVLARQFKDRPWIADFHSYYDVCRGQSVGTGEFRYYYCIPYNEDTKHLLGSSNEAPEFYRYWED